MKTKLNPKRINYDPMGKSECHKEMNGICSIIGSFKLDYNKNKAPGESQPHYCQELFVGMLVGNLLDEYKFNYKTEFYDSGIDEDFYVVLILNMVTQRDYNPILFISDDEKQILREDSEKLRSEITEVISEFVLMDTLEEFNFQRLIHLAKMQSIYANKMALPAFNKANNELDDGRHRTCIALQRGLEYILVNSK